MMYKKFQESVDKDFARQVAHWRCLFSRYFPHVNSQLSKLGIFRPFFPILFYIFICIYVRFFFGCKKKKEKCHSGHH